jgi:hypothetical protein
MSDVAFVVGVVRSYRFLVHAPTCRLEISLLGPDLVEIVFHAVILTLKP